MKVANPGGLTTAHMAVVTVGDLTCVEEGAFEPAVETVMTAEDLESPWRWSPCWCRRETTWPRELPSLP